MGPSLIFCCIVQVPANLQGLPAKANLSHAMRDELIWNNTVMRKAGIVDRAPVKRTPHNDDYYWPSLPRPAAYTSGRLPNFSWKMALTQIKELSSFNRIWFSVQDEWRLI
jgi:hypothetical protein